MLHVVLTEEGAEELMKEIQITSADIDRVDLQQLYQTAFPEEEQIPWKELMRLVDEMPLDSRHTTRVMLLSVSPSFILAGLSTGSGTLPSRRNCEGRALASRY